MPASEQQMVLSEDSVSTDDLVSKRATSLYGVHAYHTKVPPAVIQSFITRHTAPGAVVVDPFCGSGMTGVAAALSGRRAKLSDLSPAAVHIARNYSAPCDASAFLDAVERVHARVGARVRALYETREGGRAATLEYLVWSDVRACPKCRQRLLLWDFREAGLRRLTCPRCGFEAAKGAFPVVDEEAVEANLSQKGSARVVRPALDRDLWSEAWPPSDLAWFPEVPFTSDRPMWRKGHEELGIRSVADFFSRRNLFALSLLWAAVGEEEDERLRSALRFSLTAVINRASRRYQWNAKRPTNVLGGTLYVSSLRYEWNVLSLWKRKSAAVARLFADNPMPADVVEVKKASAIALPWPNASIDYCFTDPPFGGHIVYSDSSLLWESWLGDLMNREDEAIVVSGGDSPKGLATYEAMLKGSFAELKRVLRPGGKATVIFQATDPEVWKAIQAAASNAGLGLLEAVSLDKGQPSFKQLRARKGERVAGADIVLTFGTNGAVDSGLAAPTVESALEAALRGRVNGDMSVSKLYAPVNARLLAGGGKVLEFDELKLLLEARPEVDNG